MSNYDLESREIISINGIELPVLPTDISFFSDNKLLEEPYIRAPGAITFRSKHSESMLTMSFAFPLMELATPDNYDPIQRELAEKGLQLIAALNNYPFCFIKSNRLDSYLGLHNLEKDDTDDPSSGRPLDDVLMFGVKKISLSQDARVPGILLLEVQLLFNNHRILTPSMVINFDHHTTPKGGTSPIGLNQFLDILSSEALQTTKMLLQANSESLAADNFNTFNTLSQISILVPNILNLDEYGVGVASDKANSALVTGGDLVGNIENLPFDTGDGDDKSAKFFRMPNPYLTPAFYVNGEAYSEINEYPSDSEVQPSEFEKSAEEIAETNSNAHPLYAMYWEEDQFAYDNNINAIQNIVIEKERAFASQMIGAYQHPILQYMGHYPARLSINSTYVSNNYDESKSIHYLYKIMLGVIDSINVRYPLANAFNYVKIYSVITSILGIHNFIPHQSQIEAASQTGGLESFTCMFIENSMDKMREASKVNIGRELVSVDNNLAYESIIQDYLNKLDSYLKSGKKLEEKEEQFHHIVLDSLIRIIKAMKGELQNDVVDISGSQPKGVQIPQGGGETTTTNSGSESNSVSTGQPSGGNGSEYFKKSGE